MYGFNPSYYYSNTKTLATLSPDKKHLFVYNDNRIKVINLQDKHVEADLYASYSTVEIKCRGSQLGILEASRLSFWDLEQKGFSKKQYFSSQKIKPLCFNSSMTRIWGCYRPASLGEQRLLVGVKTRPFD